MGFKPSEEEQKWAKQQELDIKKLRSNEFYKRRKIHVSDILEIDCPKDNKRLDIVQLDATGIYVYKCDVCGGIWISRPNQEKILHSPDKSTKLIKYLAKVLNVEIDGDYQ